MSRLLGLLPRHHAALGFAASLALAGAMTALVVAAVTGRLLHAAVHGDIPTDALLGLVALGVARIAFGWLQGRISLRIAGRLATDLRTQLIEHATRLDMDEAPTSEISTRLTYDVSLLQGFVGNRLPNTVADVLTAAALGAYAFSLDPRTLLFAAAPLALFAPVVFFTARRSSRRMDESRTRYASMVGTVLETLDARAVLRHYGARVTQAEKARVPFDAYETASIIARDASALTRVFVQFAALLGVLFSAAALAEAVAHHTMDDARALTILAALMLAMRPVGRLVGTINESAQILPAARRVSDLLARALLPDDLDTRVRTDGFEEIVIEDLVVRRGDRVVIDHLSMRIQRGDRIVIQGENGSGKTTLLLALLGLLPSEGRILIDGKPGNLAPLAAWVPQEPAVIAGTIFENVTLGATSPDRAHALEALTAVGAASWLESRGGLDAPIAPGGKNLSRGERQRLCIARAIYRDAPILVMDEPTASLDRDSTTRIIEYYLKLSSEHTSVTVSHDHQLTRAPGQRTASLSA